jgi:hypothetical protein
MVPLLGVLMTLTEAPENAESVAEGVAAMKAESERRLSLMDAANGVKPAETAKPSTESAEAQKPHVTETPKDSAPPAPASPDKPAEAPKVVEAVDLRFVPEQHRPFVEKAPAEFQKYLREWQADYTRKTTAVADEKKAVEARKSAADFGDAVMGDEEALSVLHDLAKRRRDGTAKVEASVALPLTDEEWQQQRADIIKNARDEALREFRGERQTEAQVLAERHEIATATLKALNGHGYAVAEVDAVFEKLGSFDGMRDLLKRRGKDLSADSVVETLLDFLPAKTPEKPKEQDSPPATVVAKNGVNGASALGRGSGAPPLNLPAFAREGREPRTLDERIEESLLSVNRKRAARGLPPLTRS